MITTYDLGDPVVQRALVDELCALGFDAEVCAGRHARSSLTVTHPIEEAGRLDGLVYAADPTADIAMTVVDREAGQVATSADAPAADVAGHGADTA
ncbi:hypothetical protein SAMN04489844_1648 [Nocardioides exalbidus]|uniref:Uncharacterized protein n=1 Tax=Nocardioides exalbidus TaxID=402596 RepID=A0A1H4PMY7_9ACTN|nr:hypothetical protein [Nocardioides exalbidus]SEC08552.1 hypothetical protein SAMN04489844_1648 [Nocardioides exalbidus]